MSTWYGLGSSAGVRQQTVLHVWVISRVCSLIQPFFCHFPDHRTGRMILCSSASRLLCHSRKAAIKASKLISLSFTTCNYDLACDREYDLLSDDEKISDEEENQLKTNLVDKGFLSQLRENGSVSNVHLLNRVVSSCAKLGSFDVGVQLHAVVIKMGFLSNVYICTALLDVYRKCGKMSSAQRLFDEIADRNVVTWNSLISCYLHASCPEIALGTFMEMTKVGIIPSSFSVSAALVCCTRLQAGDIGAQVHGVCLKAGYAHNVVLGTGLVDMYSKCSNVEDSRRVFDRMQDKNIITWTAMVGGYAHTGNSQEAMILIKEMLHSALRLNYATYNSLLSSFSGIGDLDNCKQVHGLIIRDGFDSNAYIEVTLVTVYSRCSGSLEDFNKLCLEVKRWDQIAWNAVISGYTNLGSGVKALKCFLEMRKAYIEVDFFTVTSVLGATGMIPALEEGKLMHALALKIGYASYMSVQNGLVSMYARCGAINDSKKLFWSIGKHDMVSWNSLLSGFAQHGYAQEAIELFEQMRETNVKPNDTTFLAVLSACSHGGFLDKGLEYFDLMRNDSSLEPPKVEHYAVIVDLLGRAGCLTEAEAFITSMPLEPGPSVYRALLSACQVHGNKDIAIRTAKKLLELWPADAATYVLLSMVFKTEGFWNEAACVCKLMCDEGVSKKPAYSWV